MRISIKMTKAKKRGRPRQFDADKALKAMADEFSLKGFSATSLDDLARASGVNRPSIYAAFGNKLSIFLAVIDLHFEQFEREMAEAVDERAPLEEYMNQFYAAELEAYFHGSAAQGSFVFSNAVAEAPAHPEIGVRIVKLIAALEEQVAKRVAVEIKGSDRDASEANPIAQLAIGYLMTLSNKARAGCEKAAVMEDAKRVSALLARLAR